MLEIPQGFPENFDHHVQITTNSFKILSVLLPIPSNFFCFCLLANVLSVTGGDGDGGDDSGDGDGYNNHCWQ